MGPEFIDSEPRTRAISDRHSAVAHHLEQIAIGIEKINTVVIAPVDLRGAFDSGPRETFARDGKIARLHLERMMTAAERVRDERFSRGVCPRRSLHLEPGEALAADSKP